MGRNQHLVHKTNNYNSETKNGRIKCSHFSPCFTSEVSCNLVSNQIIEAIQAPTIRFTIDFETIDKKRSPTKI